LAECLNSCSFPILGLRVEPAKRVESTTPHRSRLQKLASVLTRSSDKDKDALKWGNAISSPEPKKKLSKGTADDGSPDGAKAADETTPTMSRERKKSFDTTPKRSFDSTFGARKTPPSDENERKSSSESEVTVLTGKRRIHIASMHVWSLDGKSMSVSFSNTLPLNLFHVVLSTLCSKQCVFELCADERDLVTCEIWHKLKENCDHVIPTVRMVELPQSVEEAIAPESIWRGLFLRFCESVKNEPCEDLVRFVTLVKRFDVTQSATSKNLISRELHDDFIKF
jgi:hypothetical protein